MTTSDSEGHDGSAARSERAAEQADEAAASAAQSAVSSAASAARAREAASGSDRGEIIVADAGARQEENALLNELGVDVEDPDLQQELRRLQAGASDDLPYGAPGPPIARTSPFAIGFQGALGVLAAAALAWAIVAAGEVLVLVGISLFVAVGLNPPVIRLQRAGLSRRVAVSVVAAAVAVAMVAFAAFAVPPLFRQANRLRMEAPRYAEQLADGSPVLADLDRRFDLTQRLETLTNDEELLAEGNGDELVQLARGAVTAAAATLTMLVLTLYFLAGLPGARLAAERLVPRSRRARAGLLTEGVVDRIGGYVLGKVVTAVIAGLAAFIVLVALGVPHAVALAMFVAITDVIPIIGALLGAAVATGVAFTVSVPAGVTVLVFFVVYQQFENLWLMPRVMEQTIDVSPAVSLVAALIGGVLFGVAGALLAIPIAASVKLIIEQVVVPAQESR